MQIDERISDNLRTWGVVGLTLLVGLAIGEVTHPNNGGPFEIVWKGWHVAPPQAPHIAHPDFQPK
jgi:hypothetical protein